MLTIKNLHAKAGNTEILKGINLTIETGKIHVLMGPNGSGKSTLSAVIMGHPGYEVTKGSIELEGTPMNDLSPTERSLAGIFLSFQYPRALEGVSYFHFLRTILNAHNGGEKISFTEFTNKLTEVRKILGIPKEVLDRYVNVDFSGGEKKKAEIMQLLMIQPKLAILDETDSGLDIDALKVVSKGINSYANTTNSVLLITHYKRILDHITPDVISIMRDGKIIHTGGPELADKLESEGYSWTDGMNEREIQK